MTPTRMKDKGRRPAVIRETAPRGMDKATHVRWFADLERDDVAEAGGKGANLGELARTGIPVPDGFVVTVAAYKAFIQEGALEGRIMKLVEQLDTDDPGSLREASQQLQRLVQDASFPDSVAAAISDAYERLKQDGGDRIVAIRSSATAEDTAQLSFAGMFESFTNVRGRDLVLERVRDCWASGFGERVLFYRAKHQLPADMPIAVVVQEMVAPVKAGVMFTADPATGDRSRLVIEAAWGLGEVVVAGEVTPDRYVVDKTSLATTDEQIGRKDFLLAFDEKSGKQVRVGLEGDERATARVLSAEEVHSIAELGVTIEKHYEAPQDIEFTVAGNGDIAIVQSRPITTLGRDDHEPPPADAAAPSSGEDALLRGTGVSPGIASGNVRVLMQTSDSGQLQQGEILITRMTSPDWVPVMRRAAAIVTDAGGATSHAAIVSRELGIPCVVGAHDATTRLKNGMLVTVDGREGTVRAGGDGHGAPAQQDSANRNSPADTAPSLVTGTKLYVNLAEPDQAAEIAARDVDGVGLLRAEFMLLAALDNTHPKRLIEEKRGDEFVDRLKDGLLTFARAFHPRPILYRTTDFRSNEFRGLEGGEEYEPVEANPMIGYRGCFRYTNEPDIFNLELRALHEVRREHDNLHLMIPFVRTKWELERCLRLVDESPLGGDRRLERWIMAEVPSVTFWLPEYSRLGIFGVSIGTNDLTQLVLGVDRDNESLEPLYDERDPGVLDAVRAIVVECRRLGMRCSICGQAPSVHPEYAELLVQWGVDSISVSADALDVTRRNIAAAERRLMLDRARTDR